MVGIKLITDYTLPETGPLSLSRVKEHLRVSGDDENSLLTGYLLAAARLVEDYTGLSVLSATYRQRLDSFAGSAGAIRLLRSPATSVTGIAYTDADGNSATMEVADVTLEGDAIPSRVYPNAGESWPSNVSVRGGAVSVTFVAGYASGDAVPKHLVQAIYLLVGHWYENREGVVVGMSAMTVPMAVDALLSLCKSPEFDYSPECN